MKFIFLKQIFKVNFSQKDMHGFLLTKTDENKNIHLYFQSIYERDSWKKLFQEQISKFESWEHLLSSPEGKKKYKEEQIRKYEEQQRETKKRAMKREIEKKIANASTIGASWKGEITLRVEGEYQAVWTEVKDNVIFFTSIKKRVKRTLQEHPIFVSTIQHISLDPSTTTYKQHCLEIQTQKHSLFSDEKDFEETWLMVFKDEPSKEKFVRKIEEIQSKEESGTNSP